MQNICLEKIKMIRDKKANKLGRYMFTLSHEYEGYILYSHDPRVYNDALAEMHKNRAWKIIRKIYQEVATEEKLRKKFPETYQTITDVTSKLNESFF